MNIRRSRVAAVTAGALVVVGLGATGANAAGLLDGSDIKNSTITYRDLSDGSVRSAEITNGAIQGRDIADGSISFVDLAPGVENTLAENLKAGDRLDSNGQRSVQWTDMDRNLQDGSVAAVQIPSGDNLVTLDVQSDYDVPVQVTLSQGDREIVCTAIPVEGFAGSSCSASRQLVGGIANVSAVRAGNFIAESSMLDIEINGVQIGG